MWAILARLLVPTMMYFGVGFVRRTVFFALRYFMAALLGRATFA
ncbi:hypothetical protein [Rothia uropygialis]|nr:hypothetical protein [Kocuria sp. 36]